MNKFFGALVCLWLFLLNGQAFPATVNDIAVSITDTYIVISVITDAAAYKEVHVPPPLRIVVDFSQSEYSADKPRIDVNKGNLIAVRIGQYKPDVTRVVLDLKKETAYTIKKTDKGFDILLKAGVLPEVGKEEKKEIIEPEVIEEKEQKKIIESPQVPEIFTYSTRGRKDPFRPLVGLASEEDTLLDVRGAQVVGIVWSPQERYALIQAEDGEVFIVEEGDRIRNGKVSKVDKKSVDFTLWELGRTERLTLRIIEKE